MRESGFESVLVGMRAERGWASEGERVRECAGKNGEPESKAGL